MSKENNQTYHMVREFHKAFGHKMADKPTAIDDATALNRTIWTGEELVEFLYGTVGGDLSKFEDIYELFKQGLDKAANKIRTEKKPVDDVLVAQMDALIDVEYFNQGSFTIAGVEPFNLFKIVQEANMGKLFDDGKPRYREEDGKIIKPPLWEENFAPEPRLIKEIERQLDSSENTQRLIDVLYTVDKNNVDFIEKKQKWKEIYEVSSSAELDSPTNLTVTKKVNENKSVDLTLTWDAGSQNVDGYLIYLHSDTISKLHVFGSDPAKEIIAVSNSSKNSYTFSSLPLNKFYSVGIKSYMLTNKTEIHSELVTLNKQIYA
ncbi:hypothetical protein CHH57_02305 [Niallia circulans]|uniref:DUF7359 domain-containing protein n=1 Tax=Niallia circulans TaxID=1397 RepID=A0AA91TVF9_NIACI|nr:hypothetical protein CHH57_02305 [Niallia circulans]